MVTCGWAAPIFLRRSYGGPRVNVLSVNLGGADDAGVGGGGRIRDVADYSRAMVCSSTSGRFSKCWARAAVEFSQPCKTRRGNPLRTTRVGMEFRRGFPLLQTAGLRADEKHGGPNFSGA